MKCCISFAEFVGDFELFSGLRLEDPAVGRNTTWARRAEFVRLLFGALFKYTSGYRNQEHLFPRGRDISLGPFGIGTKLQGFRVRPRFVMWSSTEKWVAQNAIRQAIANQTGAVNLNTTGRPRDGALSLPPTYEGLVVAPIYQDPAIRSFRASLTSLPPRRRLRGKQQR